VAKITASAAAICARRPLHGLRVAVLPQVVVVERQVADPCDLDGHAVGCELAGRLQRRGVEGAPPQAARDAENLHDPSS
jgi:hypothetical protein